MLYLANFGRQKHRITFHMSSGRSFKRDIAPGRQIEVDLSNDDVRQFIGQNDRQGLVAAWEIDSDPPFHGVAFSAVAPFEEDPRTGRMLVPGKIRQAVA